MHNDNDCIATPVQQATLGERPRLPIPEFTGAVLPATHCNPVMAPALLSVEPHTKY